MLKGKEKRCQTNVCTLGTITCTDTHLQTKLHAHIHVLAYTCTHTYRRWNGFYVKFVFLFLIRKINVFIILDSFFLSEMVRSILLSRPNTESACWDSCPQQSVWHWATDKKYFNFLNCFPESYFLFWLSLGFETNFVLKQRNHSKQNFMLSELIVIV